MVSSVSVFTPSRAELALTKADIAFGQQTLSNASIANASAGSRSLRPVSRVAIAKIFAKP
jgi:hypothetical protein